MAAKVGKGSVRKSKPIVTKTSLKSPYEKMWKPVTGEDMQFILKTLTDKFTQLGLKKIEVQKKFVRRSKKKKNVNTATEEGRSDNNTGMEEDKSPKVEKERSDKEVLKQKGVKPGWTHRDIRKHLAIGINEVTRALENDEVHLVIVCKSTKPEMITKHIIELSASREVPACQVPRLSENVAPVLGLKSVLALGFRKTSDVFLEEVREIKTRVPPLDVPWLANKSQEAGEDTKVDAGAEGDENTKQAAPRKRKHPKSEEGTGGVKLQALKVKKIVPNPNKKRKVKAKKAGKKK
ncbi:ribonuclease P protein subunit p38 [Hyperolius riggenbachi]|uniref:ribonuclease P protein subunit p38 n=1 Tax=Hyperolius riggenbachi TaxID=752182 RepID=UPI0035A2A061